MALQPFLALVGGRFARVFPLQTSTGASNAGAIVALNALGLVDLTALPLLASQYKLAINAVISVSTSVAPTPCDAMFQAVVGTGTGIEGDSTVIAWRSIFAPPGGQLETLLNTWLTTATSSGGLGLSASQAATQIASVRANALTQPA